MLGVLTMLKFKPTGDPEERSIEVAQSRNYDMAETFRAYRVVDGWLHVPENDTEGLTQSEIDRLETHEAPI